MDQTSETIRHQMDETKLQLAEKLESLEQQVSDTVQSTGTAVTATAEAVQETVQSVTGAVRQAVHTVSNALDIPRQIERHPWLVIGGCIALGYLAVDVLRRTPERFQPLSPLIVPPRPPVKDNGQAIDHSAEVAAMKDAMTAAVKSAIKSGQDSSSWHQLREAAIGVLIGVVQDVAARAVPLIIDQFSGPPATNSTQSLEMTSERRNHPTKHGSPEVDRRLRVASPENVRSNNSFSQGASS